jgi:hypothetical protein
MMHVATDDERNCMADRSTFPEHIQMSQIFWIEAQLNARTDQRWIDRIAITGQRHGCRGRHPPQH